MRLESALNSIARSLEHIECGSDPASAAQLAMLTNDKVHSMLYTLTLFANFYSSPPAYRHFSHLASFLPNQGAIGGWLMNVKYP